MKLPFIVDPSKGVATIELDINAIVSYQGQTTNKLPVVTAGSSQTITLPVSSVKLDGSATDSDGTITGYLWSKTSGPAATILAPTSATTSVTGLVAGTYVFNLKVTDNAGGVSNATVTIIVKSATTNTQRQNIKFEALGSEADAISKWPVIGTTTAYGITRSIIGGKSAIRFEVRKGDPIFAGGARAEVNLYPDTTRSYPYEVYYGMSYFVPVDWVNDQNLLFDIVHQWHDEGGTLKSPFDFNIENNMWMFQTRSVSGEQKFPVAVVEKGKWIDFVFHLKFVKSGTGLVEIWKDGINVISKAIPMGWGSATMPPFFKMGIYKWPWNPHDNQTTNSSSHVIYIANFRLGTAAATYDDVKP